MKGKSSFDAMWARRQLDAIEYLYTETNLSAEARAAMRQAIIDKLEEHNRSDTKDGVKIKKGKKK